MQIFFTTAIGLDININVLEDYIPYLDSLGFVYIFLFNKNKYFQPGASLKLLNGRTWSRYSDMNKFIIRKDLSFQN